MKHNLFNILLVGVVALVFSGCTDWLSVDPIDKILEKQVFTSESNTQKALNGLYLQMGKNNLYGLDLSSGTIELLGQQYANGIASADDNPFKYYMLRYNYTVDKTKDKFTAIWKEAYSAILNINNFIVNLEATEGVITQSRKDILLGEAYGLRAYLHLDLLRLFGPVYLTDSTNISVIYRTESKIEYKERIAATEVMDRIMSDLDRSIGLLKDDPVIELGAMAMPQDSLTAAQKKIDSFYRYRNRRMNYYAANVLKVRALMYRNDKASAKSLAKALLESEAIPKKFPWATPAQVTKTNEEDIIFSSEVVFGVEVSTMYSNWTSHFSPGITKSSTLYGALLTNMMAAYDIDANQTAVFASIDWRAAAWKSYTSDGTLMVTYKLAKPNKETTFQYLQPLIRKAELYYVLAECEEDINYIDEVRQHRGLKKVSEIKTTWELATEIKNEYVREMHNEGQMFFYYKRLNLPSIQNGSLTSSTISMSNEEYVIPIPERELDVFD